MILATATIWSLVVYLDGGITLGRYHPSYQGNIQACLADAANPKVWGSDEVQELLKTRDVISVACVDEEYQSFRPKLKGRVE
jgi:hypothetical protein